jgi:hypothetical protein
MNQLSIFCESPAFSEDIRRQLAGAFKMHFHCIEKIREADPQQYAVFDIDLNEISRLPDVKAWLKQRPKDSKAIFVIDKASHLETVRAKAVGATDIVHRPIDRTMLLSKLCGEFETLRDAQWDFPAGKSEGMVAAYEALQDVFSSACLGKSLDPAIISAASRPLIRQIEKEGLASWIDTVRNITARPISIRSWLPEPPSRSVSTSGSRTRTGSGCHSPECFTISARPESRFPSWKSRAHSTKKRPPSCGNIRSLAWTPFSRPQGSIRKWPTW